MERRRYPTLSLVGFKAVGSLRTRSLLGIRIDIFIQNKDDWEFISSLISGSSWQKCKFRWLSLRKVKLITNKWSKEESELLGEVIA